MKRAIVFSLIVLCVVLPVSMVKADVQVITDRSLEDWYGNYQLNEWDEYDIFRTTYSYRDDFAAILLSEGAYIYQNFGTVDTDDIEAFYLYGRCTDAGETSGILITVYGKDGTDDVTKEIGFGVNSWSWSRCDIEDWVAWMDSVHAIKIEYHFNSVPKVDFINLIEDTGGGGGGKLPK